MSGRIRYTGVKLSGAQNDFCIDDPEIDPILEELEKRDSMLALHAGADFYDNTHPARAGRIDGRHPRLRMLLAHTGGVGVPDLGSYCIEMGAEHPNLMLIGSSISYVKVMKVIKAAFLPLLRKVAETAGTDLLPTTGECTGWSRFGHWGYATEIAGNQAALGLITSHGFYGFGLSEV